MRFTRLPTSKTSPCDVIVIGAGINGCASAYFLHQAGLKVVLFDQEKIAAGGSGAAGAFISPKISKSGPLKEIVEKAHRYAIDFYPRCFPQTVLCRPLLHIAKTPEDAEKVRAFKASTTLQIAPVPTDLAHLLVCEANEENAVYLCDGAVVDASAVCRALAEGIDVCVERVESLEWNEGMWKVGDVFAKHVVLAIGAYPKLFDLPYLRLRSIWGHRIDVRTSTRIPSILHHHVSISPTSEEGIVAIGATHNVHFSPFGDETYDVESGRAELIAKASNTLILKDIEVLRDYTGLRSGSNDYMPILGPLVDAQRSLSDREGKIHYYPNLTMINGSGGYGFVLAPYLAEQLARHVSKGDPIDTELLPERFYKRWLKNRIH